MPKCITRLGRCNDWDPKLEAEIEGSRYLADANEAAERGNTVKAERLYAKGQWWLDRYNKLAGNT